MFNAVMYGAGNIGRGFIGSLFAQSGYAVTFIDIDDKVVSILNTKNSYPVRIVSNEGFKDFEINNVAAINGQDTESVANAIAKADIMATAVGANVLKFIAPIIATGIRRRFSISDLPLNIIICENLINADKLLAELIKADLDQEEKQLFDSRVGLVEASIGRMVPVQTPEMQQGEPLRVCVEPYDFLPVDKNAFKGVIPDIRNMVPFEPFSFYIKRKLYIHNMGHAVCAYMGDYSGKEFIYQSIDDAETMVIVTNAMLESALALNKQYNVAFADLQNHLQDLLFRFTNTALKDTCLRVGADPRRKLSPDDRLIGSAALCLKQGIQPVFIATGIAGGIFRLLKEENKEQNPHNAQQVLREIAGLDDDHDLSALVIPFYARLVEGSSIADIRRAAIKIRADRYKGII